MKDLKATRGDVILRAMVAEGEHERQDFKFAISDARKIARSISAFANHLGGRLLIGVKDNGTIAGVRNEEDIYVVEQAAERYCRPAQTVEFKAYRVEGTHHVIVAHIAPSATKPVMAGEHDGTWKAYVRVADENIAAPPLMVRAWDLAASGTTSPLGERHAALMRIVGQKGSVADEREAALALHISTEAAAEAISSLAAAGLLGFIHTPSGFRIVQK